MERRVAITRPRQLLQIFPHKVPQRPVQVLFGRLEDVLASHSSLRKACRAEDATESGF